jgi:putative NADPH-quinone reductase
MKILVILAHPDPASFNHALAERVCSVLNANHHHVIFHDLYREGFDPVLPAGEIARNTALPPAVSQHCHDLQEAEGIVIVHPNWWGQPPAILKGWIDRIIRPGVAYEFREGDKGEGVPFGLLKAKSAIVLNTSNTQKERELAVFGDPLETLWKNCIFGLCEVNDFHRRMFGIIITSSLSQRKQWLDEAETLVNQVYPKA